MSEMNPFQVLAEVYEKQVNDHDSSGYAEDLKKCTERFLSAMNECLVHQQVQFHYQDITYLDGYFIFGKGTNSVVHFHVDECPGWLFGIWWNVPEKDSERQKKIKGEFFAQFEEAIDKFKPSNSDICKDISVSLDESSTCVCWSAAAMVKFIKNEPYLAFCRDYMGWNYNEEFHSREEAKKEFEDYRKYTDSKAAFTKENDDKVIAFIKTKIVPRFLGARIVDKGDSWSPRYEVIAPFEENKNIVDEPGTYGWLGNDEEDVAIDNEYKSMLKEIDAAAEKQGFLWFSPFNPSVFFYK